MLWWEIKKASWIKINISEQNRGGSSVQDQQDEENDKKNAKKHFRCLKKAFENQRMKVYLGFYNLVLV